MWVYVGMQIVFLTYHKYGELLYSDCTEGIDLAKATYQVLQLDYMDDDVKYAIGNMIGQ